MYKIHITEHQRSNTTSLIDTTELILLSISIHKVCVMAAVTTEYNTGARSNQDLVFSIREIPQWEKIDG